MSVARRAKFGGPEWVEIVGEEASRLLNADGPAGERFVLVERYLDAPADRAPVEPVISGYRMEIADGRVSIRYGVSAPETGDLTVDVAFAAAAAMCALENGPELERLFERFREEGLVRSSGAATNGLLSVDRLHDAVVARTLGEG